MIKPLGDRVYLEIQENVTKSGIVLQEKKRPSSGKVLGIGTDVEGIKEGDTIHFNPNATDVIEVDGEKVHLIRQGNILCIVE